MALSPYRLNANKAAQKPPQPYSPQSIEKHPRIEGATVTESVCPYCAVGCGLLVYTKRGKVIDIEGNPRSPINEGTLCPKGANSYQLAVNPHRITQVLYRAPYSDRWETRTLEWAMEQIARRVKETRDAELREGEQPESKVQSREPRERNPDPGLSTLNPQPSTNTGIPHNPPVKSFGTLGGATLDNEENYLIKKLFSGGLGVLSIENQARI